MQVSLFFFRPLTFSATARAYFTTSVCTTCGSAQARNQYCVICPSIGTGRDNTQRCALGCETKGPNYGPLKSSNYLAHHNGRVFLQTKVGRARIAMIVVICMPCSYTQLLLCMCYLHLHAQYSTCLPSHET